MNGSERMRRSKRGQVTLEFLFIFGLLTVLLLYSINATTFRQGSPSVENLRMQVAVEEKGLANAISNTINQVYAQGPGSKATAYVRLVYLRNGDYLEKAWGVSNPKIFVTYGPYSSEGNGTYITVLNGTGVTNIFSQGDNKNTFWSRSMYQAVLFNNSNAWSTTETSLGTSAQLKIGGSTTTLYGLILPTNLPPTLKVVVEWNPDQPDRWSFNGTSGEIRININPGG